MSIVSTPLSAKAIIVERETSKRLYWFWPIAAITLAFASFIVFQQHPLVLFACAVLGFIPLAGMVWLELNGHYQEAQTLLSWHGGRLFLFEKGKHIRTLRSNQIKHIEVLQGRNTIVVQIHLAGELIEQKLTRLGRGQRLQIQRIVRCLQAELAYKQAFADMPDKLASIEREIDQP